MGRTAAREGAISASPQARRGQCGHGDGPAALCRKGHKSQTTVRPQSEAPRLTGIARIERQELPKTGSRGERMAFVAANRAPRRTLLRILGLAFGMAVIVGETVGVGIMR